MDYIYIGYIFLGTSACISNGLLMWIVLRNRNLHTISNIIIVSLAFCDLCHGVIASPMEIIHSVLPNFTILGYGCLAHQVVMIFMPLVSIVHLLLVALERFVKIVYPLHYHIIATKTRTIIALLIAWFFPLILSLVPFAGVNQNMEKVNSTDDSCATLDMLPCPYLFSVLTIIGIICVLMAIMYTVIMKIAYRHAQQLRKLAIPSHRSNLAKSTELKALTVLVITVLYFVSSWTPFSVNVLDECISKRSTNYFIPALFIAYFNSSANPIIYGIGNRELRRSLLDLCCRKRGQKVKPIHTLQTVVTNCETKRFEPNEENEETLF